MVIQRINLSLFEILRDQIENLLNESVKINFPGFPISDTYGSERCENLREFVKEESAIVFVATDKENMLGLLWCHEINRMGKTRLHISEIAVFKEYRRGGIGKKLLEQAASYARESNYSEIDLFVTVNNTEAVSFYQQALFEPERLLMKKYISNK